jgi:surfeit locus 1 family protein
MRSPRFWLVTIAAALGCGATFALGLWQWGRGEQRDALQAAIEQRATLPPADLARVLTTPTDTAWLHRTVRLRGRWVPQHTVFLDNRQVAGRVGFYVVTPLVLEGRNQAVLVQRGFAPRNFEKRDQLPPVETPPGPVDVTGAFAPPPAKLYAFAQEERGAIRQNLDIARFRDETRLDLLPLTVQQAGAASEGLLRDWPRPGSGAEKNRGYAFQWWALSALIAILYVWFQFIRTPRATR